MNEFQEALAAEAARRDAKTESEHRLRAALAADAEAGKQMLRECADTILRNSASGSAPIVLRVERSEGSTQRVIGKEVTSSRILYAESERCAVQLSAGWWMTLAGHLLWGAHVIVGNADLVKLTVPEEPRYGEEGGWWFQRVAREGQERARSLDARVEHPMPARADNASVWLCWGRSASQGSGESPMWVVNGLHLTSALAAVVMGDEQPPTRCLIRAGGRVRVGPVGMYRWPDDE